MYEHGRFQGHFISTKTHLRFGIVISLKVNGPSALDDDGLAQASDRRLQHVMRSPGFSSALLEASESAVS